MTETQEAFYRVAPALTDFSPSEEGVIAYAGTRFVFFHTPMFARLFERMEEVAGPVVHRRVEAFGRQAGEDIAARLEAELADAGVRDVLRLLVASGFDIGTVRQLAGADTETTVEKMLGVGKYDGWVGDVSMPVYDEAEPRAVVEAETTFESDSYGETGETQCRFMAGVMTGAYRYLWDDDRVTVTEERCRSADDAVCRFVAEVPDDA